MTGPWTSVRRGDHKSIRGNIRFLNARTRKLERFSSMNVPDYAILSHTWASEEVTFDDLRSDPSVQDRDAYRKIRLTYDQATRDGLNYAWIDTCCIDKSSSAELSESINSMWEWYEKAATCHAYLQNVSDETTYKDWDLEWRPGFEDYLENWYESRWSTRGWTVQELIAPNEVMFYNRRWRFIGNRDGALLEQICQTTKVPKYVLNDSQTRHRLTIAQKMSWAADRNTTRLEDEAYCLMGLFNVNMPLLYEERRKAFARLQEEIIRTSTDHSIVAWPRVTSETIVTQLLKDESYLRYINVDPLYAQQIRQGQRLEPTDAKRIFEAAIPYTDTMQEMTAPTLLAPSPSAFRGVCERAVSTGRRPWDQVFSLTNQGLQIILPVLEHPSEGRLGILNCRTTDGILALRLMSVGRPQYIVGGYPLGPEGRSARYHDDRIAVVYPHHAALASLKSITIARQWPQSAGNMIRERIYAPDYVRIKQGKFDFTRFDLSACVAHTYPFITFDSRHITIKTEPIENWRIGGIAYTGVPLIDSFCVCFAYSVSEPQGSGCCEVYVGHYNQQTLRDQCYQYCEQVRKNKQVQASGHAVAQCPDRKSNLRTTASLLRAKLVENKDDRTLLISFSLEFSLRWTLLSLETRWFGDPIVSAPANTSISDEDWYGADDEKLSGEHLGISKRDLGVMGISIFFWLMSFIACLTSWVLLKTIKHVLTKL